jgi:quinol monooxygenase YgiN
MELEPNCLHLPKYRDRMIVLFATITVFEGHEGAFESLARELTAATLELESGVRRYEYTRLPERGSYHATLAFDDYEAFIVHQASEHHAVIAGAMRDHIADMRLERVDPVSGCSPLAARLDAITVRPLGEPTTADLVDRAAKYRDRYPLAPATWWGAAR